MVIKVKLYIIVLLIYFFYIDLFIFYYILFCLVRIFRKCFNYWVFGLLGKIKICILVNIEEIVNFFVFIMFGDNYKNINWILGRGEEKMYILLSWLYSLIMIRRIK